MADGRLAATAFAKVNLSLRVLARDRSGYHPLRSLAQSVDWADDVAIEVADDDDIVVSGPAPAGEDNLAWRAVAAVREETGSRRPVRLLVRKDIAVAAGLAGGSADAAAALMLAADYFGGNAELPARLAPELGSDVPFCLVGGRAWLEGKGDVITALGGWETDFALGLVVPPFELATPEVYEAWDRLEGPAGPESGDRSLPPSLRVHGPLRNDLFPAAVDRAPELGDWAADLAESWGRPVAMSGSGPALFAYFMDRDEAEDAVGSAPPETRAATAAVPTTRGVALGSGTLT